MNQVEVQFIDTEQISDVTLIEGFCLQILELLKIDNWELSVVLCKDSFIKTLNRDYRGKDEATDVLSFSQEEEMPIPSGLPVIHAGDIIISVDMLKKNSIDFKVDLDEEFKRLLIHGILHLTGLNHFDNNPENEMLAYQEKLLAHVTGVKLF
jgi:probable rRNA maturation factor